MQELDRVENLNTTINELHKKINNLKQEKSKLEKEGVFIEEKIVQYWKNCPLNQSGCMIAFLIKKFNDEINCIQELADTKNIQDNNEKIQKFTNIKDRLCKLNKMDKDTKVKEGYFFMDTKSKSIFDQVLNLVREAYQQIEKIDDKDFQKAIDLKFNVVEPGIAENYNYALVEEYNKKTARPSYDEHEKIRLKCESLKNNIGELETNLLNLNQDLNQELREIAEAKKPFIARLEQYIKKVKHENENPGKEEFEADFKTFKTNQGKSREANYKTALILLEQLKKPEKTLKDVLGRQEVQKIRSTQVTEIQKTYKGIFSTKTIRGELKGIVDDAQKSPKMK